MIVKGRDIRSRELGLPGQCSASVAYVSDQFLKTDNDKKDTEVDPTHGTHELGTATHSGLTSNPVWKTMRESEESRRLKQILSLGISDDMAGAMKPVCTDTNMSHLTANSAIDKNSSDTNVHAGNLLFGTSNKMKENDDPIPWKNGNYFTFPILQPIQQVSKNFSSKSGSSTAVSSEKVEAIRQ